MVYLIDQFIVLDNLKLKLFTPYSLEIQRLTVY